MDETIEHITTRWNLVRSFLFVVITLSFLELAATFPTDLIPVAAFASGLGILFGGWSLLNGGGRLWARAALLSGAALLLVSVMMQIASQTILQGLPLLLLGYVMLLFSAEAFELASQHHGTHLKTFEGPQASHVMLLKSLEHVTRRTVRLGLIFGGCYVLALTFILLGDMFVAALPALSDVSLYIVAVSISLALLLILREE